MGIFDKLKNTAQKAVVSAVQSAGNKRETFTFRALPESLAEMQGFVGSQRRFLNTFGHCGLLILTQMQA